MLFKVVTPFWSQLRRHVQAFSTRFQLQRVPVWTWSLWENKTIGDSPSANLRAENCALPSESLNLTTLAAASTFVDPYRGTGPPKQLQGCKNRDAQKRNLAVSSSRALCSAGSDMHSDSCGCVPRLHFAAMRREEQRAQGSTGDRKSRSHH